MTTTRFLKGFVLSFILFTLLDGVWHGGIMAQFYMDRLAVIAPGSGGPTAFSPLMIFLEAVNAAALTYFVLRNASSRNPVGDGALVGLILGFTVISTVNGLNHTLIPGWDMTLALVDTAWGTVAGLLCGIAVATVCAEPKKGLFRWFRR
jgi:uncharacterized membrane protein